MKKLNLIMPMGGGGTRFGKQGFNIPKPLITIYGKPFFFWATQSITKFIEVESITFVVLKEHIEKYNLDVEIRKYYPEASINVIPEVLPGAVLTCMQGVNNIDDNAPVLFNDCDHLFICNNFYEFCREGEFDNIDGGILTFTSDDPRFSFVSYGKDGYINRTVEKEVISNDAICGAYYFRNKKVFLEATEKYLSKCTYKEFFVSGVYNVMADNKMKIGGFKVDKHVSFGTPEEYNTAQNDDTYIVLK